MTGAQNPALRRAALLILLLALALLSAWIKHQTAPPPPPAMAGVGGPDYYLRNFTLTATGSDGRPRHLIRASYMEYQSGQETLQFITPELLFHNQGDSSWRVTAQRASVSNEGKQILMQGTVVLRQSTADGRETLKMETADLLLLPELNRARSDARVELSMEGSTLSATGLRIDLVRNHFELLHQIRGRYHASAS